MSDVWQDLNCINKLTITKRAGNLQNKRFPARFVIVSLFTHLARKKHPHNDLNIITFKCTRIVVVLIYIRANIICESLFLLGSCDRYGRRDCHEWKALRS